MKCGLYITAGTGYSFSLAGAASGALTEVGMAKWWRSENEVGSFGNEPGLFSITPADTPPKPTFT